MLNEKELCIRHPIYIVSNPYHKLMCRIILKLIIITNENFMKEIKSFVNYTSKTLNRQNSLCRFKNIWCTFMMPLDEAPLRLFDKSLHRQVISQWRLRLGK